MRRCNPATEVSSFRDTPNPLPRPLWPYFCKDWSMLRWRWVAPGVHLIRAPAPSGARLILLKIAPGKSMPMHGHTGSELTQVLQGAYHDVMGQFAAGDIADLGNDVEHQPIASIDRPCICVSVLDGPLRFHGWVARALQYWTGL
jgi:putative transcriptional regulator